MPEVNSRVFFPAENKFGTVHRLNVLMQGGTFDFGVVFDGAPGLITGLNRGEVVPVDQVVIEGKTLRDCNGYYLIERSDRSFTDVQYHIMNMGCRDGNRIKVTIEVVKEG